MKKCLIYLDAYFLFFFLRYIYENISYTSYTMLQLIPFFFTTFITFILLIINGIILLNILLIISCYLYYLYKNYNFWKIFIDIIFYIILAIILLTICLFLSINEAYAETPEIDLEAIFLEKKANFYIDKLEFDNKANSFSSWFNDQIAQVEFEKGRPTPQFKLMTESMKANESLEDHLFKIIPVEGKAIHDQAGTMLGRVSELEAMDAKIHSLSHTNFDKSEYQKLTVHFMSFRSSNRAVEWYALKHPNKVLLGMDLKNRYF
jgi:hypothetical protein